MQLQVDLAAVTAALEQERRQREAVEAQLQAAHSQLGELRCALAFCGVCMCAFILLVLHRSIEFWRCWMLMHVLLPFTLHSSQTAHPTAHSQP